MSKLIDEAKIFVGKQDIWLDFHPDRTKYWQIHLTQKFKFIPRYLFTNNPTNLKHRDFYYKYPDQFERLPFIRLCDRIGKMLAKQ